jgi:hypothetical protein
MNENEETVLKTFLIFTIENFDLNRIIVSL